MKKLKITAMISGILTLLQVLPPLISAVWAWFSLMPHIRTASSIGIIGGADGPTAIYTVTMFPMLIIIARYIFFAACLLTFIVSTVILIKNKKKNNG